jgi:hypothetical protein
MKSQAIAEMIEFGKFPTRPADKRGAFSLVHISELELKCGEWTIKDFFEVDSLALIYGDSETLKSFGAIDMCACCASGKDFHGKKVKQGPAIYICGEGQNGIKRRLTAWSIHYDINLNQFPFYVSLVPAALCAQEETQYVIDRINEVAIEHGAPALVVLDTVARNFGPGDENSTKDMSTFIKSADAIRAAHGSTVLLVHHTGHNDKSRARGAIALRCALDAEYRFSRDKQDIIRCECTKMKDFEPIEPVAFKPITVDLGITDEDGRPVTSAVLEQTLYKPRLGPGNSGKGKNQRAV